MRATFQARTEVELAAEVERIRGELLEAEAQARDRLSSVHPDQRESARNLVHYVALRGRELRPLQLELMQLGVSSLGRSEAAVLPTLEAVLRILRCLSGDTAKAVPLDITEGRRRLTAHTERLFGPAPAHRNVRIMVTLPPEAASDPRVVSDLLARGTDAVRINLAHDHEAAWARMVANVRAAEANLGRRVSVLMDLAGVKLRTGAIAPEPRVIKWRPVRDRCGRVVTRARIGLAAPDAGPQSDVDAGPPNNVEVVLPVPRAFLATLAVGDLITLTDLRGRRRRLSVVEVRDAAATLEGDRTAYVGAATILKRRASPSRPASETALLPLEPEPGHIALEPGDLLVLTRAETPGRPALRDATGASIAPARVALSPPELIDAMAVGHPIWFDDGRAGGVVEAISAEDVHVRIRVTPPHGLKLRDHRGVNLPSTPINLPSLTESDRAQLDFVAKHADLVGLSFVSRPEDIQALRTALLERGAPGVGILLKIETERGFANLPELLLEAMRAPRVGVMIARGDLAVECGFERLAEIQEEILWLSEAAHVPVVWATQVLESLAKSGAPSRAEITDAGMAERAECVMLNKGPYVGRAVEVLDDILRRMQSHVVKKSALLSARAFGRGALPSAQVDHV